MTSLTDPLANAVWEDSRGWTVSGNQETSYHTVTRWEYSAHTGRQLAKIVTDAQRDVVRTIERNWYDASGNRQEWGSSATLVLDETMHERTRAYYDASERLRVVDRQRCMTKVVGGVPVCAGWNYQRNAEKGAFEEYRYDALGRRVLVRRRLAIVNDTELTETCTACWNTVDRFVWDGDNILWEVRANGATAPESDAAVGLHLGQVGYTHALGIDQPVSILRRGYASLAPFILIPHADYRGVLAAAHYPSGRAIENGLDVRSLPWAGANSNAYMAKLLPSQPDKWIGSIAENLADASGQLYRRNRYYDPQSGRFTQEDPIGLAGGLNLYGFGGGDPVSYTDPFGLCPWWMGSGAVCDAFDAYQAKGATGLFDFGAGLAPGLSTAQDAKVLLTGTTFTGNEDSRGMAAAGVMTPLSGPVIGTTVRRGVAAVRMVKHHIFPVAFRAEFLRAGLDVDSHAMSIPEDLHKHLHGWRGGRWNAEWRQFFKDNPDADYGDIVEHGVSLIQKYGISGVMQNYE